MNTPYIDQFVTLAKAYERVEHGREEEVHGYMGKLQHSLDHPRLGMLRPASWSAFLSDKGLDELGHAGKPGHMAGLATIHAHLEAASRHVHEGNRTDAMTRLHMAGREAQRSGLKAVAKDMAGHVGGLLDEAAAERAQHYIVPQFDTAARKYGLDKPLPSMANVQKLASENAPLKWNPHP